MEEKYDIFLSYSVRDKNIADELYQKLTNVGLRCFMAEKSIKAGEIIDSKILEALKYSTHVIFLLTTRSIKSKWVTIESGAAWALKKEIIPALRGVEFKQLNDLLRTYEGRIIETEAQTNMLINELSGIIDFAAFWNLFLSGRNPEENIYVLLSAKMPIEYEKGRPVPKKGHTVMISYNELDAFLKLQRELESISDKLKVVHGGVYLENPQDNAEIADIPCLPLKKINNDIFIDQKNKDFNIPEFPLNDNLIILGSTHANLVCRDIMSHSKLHNPPYKFDMYETKSNNKKKIIKIKDGTTYPSIEEIERGIKSDRIEVDYGILLRTTNPFDKEGKNKVLILGGNHGFGTQAAMKFVADRKQIKFLRSKVEDQDFEAVFRASADRLKASELDLEILKIAIMKDNKWEFVYGV